MEFALCEDLLEDAADMYFICVPILGLLFVGPAVFKLAHSFPGTVWNYVMAAPTMATNRYLARCSSRRRLKEPLACTLLDRTSGLPYLSGAFPSAYHPISSFLSSGPAGYQMIQVIEKRVRVHILLEEYPSENKNSV